MRGHLRDIAFARSGDKGSNANIGVFARTEEAYHFLETFLTEECVESYFSPLEPKKTKRYLLPRLWGLNFVLEGILPGGAGRCLRVDSQGKALAQALLQMNLEEAHEK